MMEMQGGGAYALADASRQTRRRALRGGTCTSNTIIYFPATTFPLGPGGRVVCGIVADADVDADADQIAK
jgi:hypothetical protein